MPKRKSRNGKRNRKRNGRGAANTVRAPMGMIQQVSTWDLNEVIPITLQGEAARTGNFVVSINAGVNGYDFTVTGDTG